MAKLKEEYQNRIIGELEQKLGTTNRMLVPRLQKIVVNMGFGIVSKDEQKGIVDDLTAITGQRPLLCKAKKSISNFKLREGMVIGAKVTLRGDRMWTSAACRTAASTAAATTRSASRSTRSSRNSWRRRAPTAAWT